MQRTSLDRRGFLIGGLIAAAAVSAPSAFASNAAAPRQFMAEAERMLDDAAKAGDQSSAPWSSRTAGSWASIPVGW